MVQPFSAGFVWRAPPYAALPPHSCFPRCTTAYPSEMSVQAPFVRSNL